MPLATPAAAAGAAASPGWRLTDQYTSHPACFTTGGGSEYLELNLNGTWSTPLTLGASSLPATAHTATSSENRRESDQRHLVHRRPRHTAGLEQRNGTPFGGSQKSLAEAYPVTTIPAGLTVNSTFTITFWASDGTITQTESVPIVIKSSCARRY